MTISSTCSRRRGVFNPKPTLTNEVRFGFNLGPALFLTGEQFPSAIYGGLLFSNPVNTFRAQGRYTNTYNFADQRFMGPWQA